MKDRTMLIQQTVEGFIGALASDSPAPGGGSVSALNGALAAGLLAMVCRLSVNRKDLAKSREELIKAGERALALKELLSSLVDRDTQAFNRVMNAFALPKDDDRQKKERAEAIQSAFREAVEVPLEVAADCAELLDLGSKIAEGFNPNTASDLGVGAECARAGLEGALMNVRINLPSIKDRDYVNRIRSTIDRFVDPARKRNKDIRETINPFLPDPE